MTEEATTEQSALLTPAVRETWRRWWELFNELLGHVLTIIFLIGCLGTIEWFTRLTHHGEEIILWKESSFAFHFQYLLDAGDAALVVCITAIAIYTVARSGYDK